MKITMVLGSPRTESISSKMAMAFAEGAQENGHEVTVYNINEMDLEKMLICGGNSGVEASVQEAYEEGKAL